MTRALPPLADQVLNHLGARLRLGEELFTVSTRLRPALEALRELRMVDYDTGITEGSLQVRLTAKGTHHALSATYEPPVATLHRRGPNGYCLSCTGHQWPCPTRTMLMPTEPYAATRGADIVPAGPDHVLITAQGATMRIARDDADPEERRLHYRLAATWFGNQPQEDR